MRTRRWGTASVAALVLIGAGGATAATEDKPPCERRYRAEPQRDVARGPAPLVLGDSVMWFAVDDLAELGFEADALGCRMFEDGRRTVARRRRERRLPHLVVMALGSNWKIPTAEIERTLDAMGPNRVLALVTPRARYGTRDRDPDRVRAAGRRWPGRVKVLDWARHSRGKRHWFGSDGIHVTRSGRDAYVRCIEQALPFAGRGAPARRRHPCAPD